MVRKPANIPRMMGALCIDSDNNDQYEHRDMLRSVKNLLYSFICGPLMKLTLRPVQQFEFDMPDIGKQQGMEKKHSNHTLVSLIHLKS